MQPYFSTQPDGKWSHAPADPGDDAIGHCILQTGASGGWLH